MGASEESKESSVIVEDKSDNSLDCDDKATKNSTEEAGHVINMDIEEDDAEDHRQMSPEATTSPSPAMHPAEVNNKEEDQTIRVKSGNCKHRQRCRRRRRSVDLLGKLQ